MLQWLVQPRCCTTEGQLSPFTVNSVIILCLLHTTVYWVTKQLLIIWSLVLSEAFPGTCPHGKAGQVRVGGENRTSPALGAGGWNCDKRFAQIDHDNRSFRVRMWGMYWVHVSSKRYLRNKGRNEKGESVCGPWLFKPTIHLADLWAVFCLPGVSMKHQLMPFPVWGMEWRVAKSVAYLIGS